MKPGREYILLVVRTCDYGGSCKFRRLVYSKVCALKFMASTRGVIGEMREETEPITLDHFYLFNIMVIRE